MGTYKVCKPTKSIQIRGIRGQSTHVNPTHRREHATKNHAPPGVLHMGDIDILFLPQIQNQSTWQDPFGREHALQVANLNPIFTQVNRRFRDSIFKSTQMSARAAPTGLIPPKGSLNTSSKEHILSSQPNKTNHLNNVDNIEQSTISHIPLETMGLPPASCCNVLFKFGLLSWRWKSPQLPTWHDWP